MPGESDSAFYKRMQSAAGDPQVFEQFVCEKPAVKKHEKAPLKENNGGYQRIEDWEEQEQQRKKEMSWEERVQFDGLRHGNRVSQNDILRHHLNSF